MKAEWRSVLTVCGAQSVMISGELLMLLQPVGNQDTLNIVRSSTIHTLNMDTQYYSFTDVSARLFAAFGQGTGPIHLDDLQCVGNEDALINCTYDSNTADCSHFEDAGVVCQRKYQQYQTHNSHYAVLFVQYFTQLVPMERFVLREEAHSMRDVWRFVATSSGAQCVIICGLMLMQLLLADIQDTLDLV